MVCQLLFYEKTKLIFNTIWWKERSGNDAINSITEEIMIKWVPKIHNLSVIGLENNLYFYIACQVIHYKNQKRKLSFLGIF